MRSFEQKSVQDDHVQSKTPKQQVTSTPNRHQQILQMQRQYGNQAVQRMLQREINIEEMTSAISTVGNTITGTGSSANSIGDGTASITAENGVVDISAASVNINAPMTRHAGVDESEVVIADSVIASSYTPGAGNMW